MDKPISEMTTTEIIKAIPAERLLGIVMKLTSGTVNPHVVEEIIKRVKAEGE